MNPEDLESKITSFWQWFADNHLSILEIMGGRREGRVTETIDKALEDNDLHVTYEITEGTFGGELTFTPEGDPNAASFIDRLVAAAPTFDTWVIFSRRQRKTLGAALAFVRAIYDIDISDAHFKVRFLDDRFHLCFLHDGLMKMEEERRYAVAATFLDHALGEELSTEYIGQIEFREKGEGAEMGLVINEIINETGEYGLDEEDMPTSEVTLPEA